MNKTARIEFVMTEEDAARLKDLSKKTKLPVSRLIRFLIAGYCPREAPGDEFYEKMDQLIESAEQLRAAAYQSHDPDLRRIMLDAAEALMNMRIRAMRKYLMPKKADYKLI